jgi:hypothetical protein
MNYEQYRKIQIDIDHLSYVMLFVINFFRKLVKKTGNYLLQIKRVVERSSRVVELMKLPNFKNEDQELPV